MSLMLITAVSDKKGPCRNPLLSVFFFSSVFLTASDMDFRVVFATLEETCQDNIAALSGSSELPYGAVTERLVTCMRQIQEHGQALEPVVGSFTNVYHHYDFDAETPGNGYRTLVKV